MISRHEEGILKNRRRWDEKPLLRKVYERFYRLIGEQIRRDIPGMIIELGSGVGAAKQFIPDCATTDLFPNPWIDRVENAYRLSSATQSVSNLILFDVWHHLEFPGTALNEFQRVLVPGGRAILFEPDVSLLSLIVYGVFHHEPVGLWKTITWLVPEGFSPDTAPYYSAQGNCARVFKSRQRSAHLQGWQIRDVVRLSAISYVASGGYSRAQLYPTALLPIVEMLDGACDLLPWLFSTRMLVVIEKTE